MNSRNTSRRMVNQGFTLFEVLVAMIVCAVGLLGLAKMAALAVSTTQNAGSRSLIAVQMESLASMMHANPTFWQPASLPSSTVPSFKATGTTITDSTGTYTSPPSTGCVAPTTCTPAQLAAVDVNKWVADMNNQFPSYTATITCPTVAAVQINSTTTAPGVIDCSINVTWSEKQIALQANAAAGSAAQITTQSYSVYVKP
ncbi:type IV pilus modification protein PilV [Undibacterium sp. RuRC25W]|uniref:type IV pilus modification protein PilV n=1 Tax=Undibacterium sp. RuRC25W TaxID=3413047 RepID=UPI003BF2507B